MEHKYIKDVCTTLKIDHDKNLSDIVMFDGASNV